MKDSFIIDTTRTPIGNFGGSLSTVRADDLAAHVLKELANKNPQLDPKDIEDIYMGCANQAGEDNRNVARMALLIAGLPHTIGGETVNRLCASGMAAGIHASKAIQCGEGDVFISGGVEHMTRAPWVISKTSTAFGRDAQMHDSSFGWRFVNPILENQYGIDAMGQTAENLLETHQVSRQAQDEFALWSQQKASKAQQSGRLAQEISPLSIPQRKGEAISFSQDEFIKSNTTLEGLSKLKPAFKKDGSVTAGNASGLNDGAAAILWMSEHAIKQTNSKPQARVVSWATAGVEPRIMGIGPVEASKKALKRAGLSLKDMDIIEINEAFSAQVLSCLQELDIDFKDPRINPNGGAISLGHPLGMSGSRLLQTAALELQLTQKKYALCTMCIGVGQGYAVILERC